MDKSKFDIEIKREGWNKMKDILDREMPEKKRRFLPFFLLFLILGGIGASFLYSKTGENKQNESVYKKETVIEKKFEDKSNEKNGNLPKAIINTTEEKTNTKSNNRRIKNAKSNIKKNNKLDKKQYDFAAKTKDNNDIKKPENFNTHKTSGNESKYVSINNIKRFNISLFEIEQRLLLAEFEFNDLVVNRKKKTEFFNPFIGLKVHLYNYRKFAPKYEFDFGNYFKFSDRFSFGIAVSYVQTDLIFQSIQEESYVLTNNDVESKNNNFNSEAITFDIPAWTFELMLKEKYNITGKFSFDFGGGMVLGGLKFSGLKQDSRMDSGSWTEPDINNFKPVIFGEAGLYYHLNYGINAGLGYKYYYSGTYNVNENNKEVYSRKLINKEYSSRFYLGINYCF